MAGQAKCKPTFFAAWNAPEAWLAGLIWADGCLMTDPRNGHSHVLIVTTDEPMAVDAAGIAGTDYHRKPPSKKGRLHTFTVRIGSRFVIERLRELGLTPRKSLTCEFPELPAEVVPAFIRGYFDGDGSVSVYRNKNIRSLNHHGRLIVHFAGSAPFLTRLRHVLAERAGIGPNKLIRNGSIWKLQMNHADALRLATFMYQEGAGPRLVRKAAVFQGWT